MMDYLQSPMVLSSATLSSTAAFSTSSSRISCLSCSRPDFRPVHSEIVRRSLRTNFLEANSLPVNVPIHRSMEASREGFEKGFKHLSTSLTYKLLPEIEVDNETKKRNSVQGSSVGKYDGSEDMIFNLEI